MQQILNSKQGLVIDGTWTTVPEEHESPNLFELLETARRLPEVVVVLKCKEPATIERCLDKDAIKAEFDKLMKERAELREKERKEAREAKLEEIRAEQEGSEEPKTEEEIENEMKEWDNEREEQDDEADENDPDKPVYDDMLETEREKLRELREKGDVFLEDIVNSLKEKSVPVFDSL